MAGLILLRELAASECLAEGPSGGRDVVGDDGAAVAGGDPEGERLPVEARAALPVLAQFRAMARHRAWAPAPRRTAKLKL